MVPGLAVSRRVWYNSKVLSRQYEHKPKRESKSPLGFLALWFVVKSAMADLFLIGPLALPAGRQVIWS